MDMKHTLLILSVFLAFALGQKKPKVSLFPGFPSHRLYVSDEVTLRCKDGANVLESGVKWFFKGTDKPTSNATLKLPAVTVEDSGLYQCEHGGQKSDPVEIKVLDMLPQASLSVLNNADTVIGKGGAVLLKLYMEEGLNDWWCRYTEGVSEMWQPIKRDPTQSNSSLIIHADVGEGDGRTYWCMDTKKGLNREERPRSNAIKLTATGKMVMLQMSERPAWLGDDVTVTCDVWGGAQVDKAVFYKDGQEITGIQKEKTKNTIIIQNITSSSNGSYHCSATYRFTHISADAAAHSNLASDQQALTVIAGPPKPRLDCTQMKCEGLWSSKPDSYLWLYTPEGATDPEILKESNDHISSGKPGKYTCSAKWTGSGFSRKSDACQSGEIEGTNILVVVVVLFMVGLLLLLVALCICKRRTGRKNIEEGADGGYEEVGKKDGGKGGEYELLKISQEEKDKGQYDTIKGQGKGKGEGEGEYEALKAGEAEGTVYHTLKAGEAEGKGEYEALKTAQAEVYHTLKGSDQAEAEGKGEYEALKTAQAEVYHTLKGSGQAEAEGKGEYETLKTAQAEVYHTLGQGKGAGPEEGQGAKEESPYEELKKEKDTQ